MPRSHLLSHNQWRILVAVLAVTLLLCTGFQADAQQRRRRKPANAQQTNTNSNAATTADASQPKKKSLAPLRTGETPEGGRATITSDAPLNDYEAYRSGNRYYVVIPGANAPNVPGNVRGRGFDDVQVHKRGNDTVLSFRLKPGTSAHVNQKFNKLDVVFNSPADATSGAQSGTTTTANTPAGTTTAPTGTGNANSQRPNTETATATPKPPNAATAAGPTATTTPGSTSLTGTGASATPPALTTEPGSATTTTALPSVTPALGPVTETPATASPTPPTDQIAQAQPAPSVPVAVTTTPAASGSSLGAVLKSNWLIILIAALLLISIGLVAMTRSRRKGVEEPRRISDEGTPALEDAKETASAMRLDATPAVGAAAIVAAAPVEAAAQAVAPTDETEQETVEAAPPDTYNVERVRLEIKHVLTGESYDEAIINAPFSETRQLIESELLFALSRRNTERRHRALKAFTEHGYFDDATRDLRTASVPAERAAAARKLGLTRDSASTPHLVAALEDSAPEVRRAAVEALTELQDQSAIAPLESLLKREEDRKVPHALIQRAIRANSAGAAEQEEKPAVKTAESAATAVVASVEATSVEAAPVEAAPVETELVEAAPVETTPVEAAPANAEEVAAQVEETADMSLAAGPLTSSLIEESSVSAPEAPVTLEEETPTLEAEPARAEDAEAAPSEQTSELTAASLALGPAIVAGLVTAEAKASERRRAEADAARIHAEQAAERQAAEEERQRAEEEEVLRRVEEAGRLRAEAETQRVAEETRRREEEQERRRIEEERFRAEEEQRRAEEEQRRVEAERLAAEERRRAEEQQRLDEERLRVEAEQRRAEEERLRAEEEQRRAEDERRRVEAEAARQREEEAARQRAEEEKRRAEEEEHRRVALERERQEEEERLRLVEEERQRSEEARRQRAEEREKRRAEEERSRLEAEERERSEADAARRRAEEAALRLAEMRRRMEEEARLREEAEAERLRVEEEARVRAEEEAARQLAEDEEAEAARQQEEEEERQRIEAAAARQREEEAAALRLQDEERLRAEEESRRYAEEERRRVEEESRQRAEAEAARIEFEREAAERRLRAEAEAVRIEPEEIEPVYAETPPTVAQSDLFEATFAENATPVQAEEISTEATASTAPDWVDVDINETETIYDEQSVVSASPVLDEETVTAEAEPVPVTAIEESVADTSTREVEVAVTERGIAPADEDDFATVPSRILQRLGSEVASEREAAVSDLARVGGEDAFREISAAFDDPVQIVRDAAARALFNLNDDHAASFTRALREAPADRRRRIGSALASSGLANQAIGHLMGESREKTYDAFSLLFLMSKAGEVQPLMRAIEEHPSSEVRLAVVKLLALSGQQDILPAFRRLAVRGSLPTEVRSAVMEAIYQISSQTSADTTHVA